MCDVMVKKLIDVRHVVRGLIKRGSCRLDGGHVSVIDTAIDCVKLCTAGGVAISTGMRDCDLCENASRQGGGE